MVNDDLWQAIVKTVRPLGSHKRAEKPKNVSLEKKLQNEFKPLNRCEVEVQTDLRELTAGDFQAMDRKTAKKFKDGEMDIQGRLDLHGLTLDQAEQRVEEFIKSSYQQKARCLLIITGIGGLLGRGVIKSAFPSWMNKPEIRDRILSFCQASSKDGGAGAFYVLLKRQRNKK